MLDLRVEDVAWKIIYSVFTDIAQFIGWILFG